MSRTLNQFQRDPHLLIAYKNSMSSTQQASRSKLHNPCDDGSEMGPREASKLRSSIKGSALRKSVVDGSR